MKIFKTFALFLLILAPVPAMAQCLQSQGVVYKPLGQTTQCYSGTLTGAIPSWAAKYGGTYLDPVTNTRYIVIPSAPIIPLKEATIRVEKLSQNVDCTVDQEKTAFGAIVFKNSCQPLRHEEFKFN